MDLHVLSHVKINLGWACFGLGSGLCVDFEAQVGLIQSWAWGRGFWFHWSSDLLTIHLG